MRSSVSGVPSQCLKDKSTALKRFLKLFVSVDLYSHILALLESLVEDIVLNLLKECCHMVGDPIESAFALLKSVAAHYLDSAVGKVAGSYGGRTGTPLSS